MKKILLSIIAIIAVVLISGCTNTGGTTMNPNAGVVINSFVATPTNVMSGDTVLFEIEVQNVGGTTARNTRIELFDVQGAWKDRDGNIIDSRLIHDFETRLDPPMVERNLPGDLRMHQWELKTPTIPQGLNPVRAVRARVTYDFNTSGYVQMSAVSEDEFQRMASTGSAPPAPFVQNSAGPIQMAVPTAESQYIVIDTTGGEDTYVYPFKFVFTNAGTGFPVTEEEDGFIGGGGRLSGTITLLGPGVEFDDCLGVTEGTEIDLDDTEILPRVRSDNTANVACTIKFDLNEWGDRATDSVTFVFNLFYTYYESAETSVSIVGR